METAFKIFISLLVLFSAALPTFAQEKLKVGVIAPLSGAVAPMGEALRKGVSLYFEEKSPHSPVQVIFDDGQYDGKLTLSAFNKLVGIDKVDLVVVWGNTPSSVIAPVAERRKVPTFVITMEPHALHKKYVVSMGAKTEPLLDKGAEAFRAVGSKKPGAISIDMGTALQGADLMNKRLGGGMVIKTVANEERDFRGIIASFKAQGVDAIMLFAFPEHALSLERQAAELKYSVPIIGGDVFADAAFEAEFKKLLPSFGFMYGAVAPDFVAGLKARYATTAYFYESAVGFSLGIISEELAKLKAAAPGKPLFSYLPAVYLAASPVRGLRYKEDASYGVHFENDVGLYGSIGEAIH